MVVMDIEEEDDEEDHVRMGPGNFFRGATPNQDMVTDVRVCEVGERWVDWRGLSGGDMRC